jgi:hypothetical protein
MAALNIFTGVLIPLWALGHCFFGYVLFRVILALNGLAGGFLLGAHVIGLVRAEPAVADVWVAGIVGGILLMLAAWFLYRIVFAGGTGLMVAAVILQYCPGQTILAWGIATVAGVMAAGLVFVYLRDLVSVITAVAGAAAFVLVVVDQWYWQGVPQAWLGQDVWLTAGAVAGIVLLGAAGLAVQRRTPRRLSKRFGPPGANRPKTRAGNVSPKFTRI